MKFKSTLFFSLLVLFFAAHAQQPANGGFDVWTQPVNPDGWTTIEKLTGLPSSVFSFQDTADKVSGVSSMKLVTDTVPGHASFGTIPGLASLGTGVLGGNGPSFTGVSFTGRPDTLIFDFKHNAPNGADTGRVQIRLTKAGVLVLGANYILTEHASWTHVEFVLTNLYSSGLVPDTLYVQIQTSGGNGNGSPKVIGTNLHIDNLRFGYAPQTPISGVYTLGSDAIGSNNYNLYGAINTGNDTAAYSFVYSTDSTFATFSTTPARTIHDDSLAVVWAKVTGLSLATKYFYYIKDSSSAGIKKGVVMKFATDTVSYLFANFGADVYGSNYAVMGGGVHGLTDSTNISFVWGLNPDNLDSVITVSPSLVTDTNSYYYQGTPNNLTAGATYFFRLRGITSHDTVYSDIKAFYMGNPWTTWQALPATVVTATSATLNATVQGFPLPIRIASELDNQVLQTYFHYHPAYYDYTTSVINYSYNATGLTASQYYSVRLSVITWIGNYYTDTAFTTLPTGIIEVAGPASDVHVYPNPANNNLTIELNTGTNELTVAQLFNLNGQLVKKIEIPANQSKSILSVDELESGVYLLKLLSGDMVFNNKITIVK